MLKPSAPADYEELIRVIHERHDDMSKSYQRDRGLSDAKSE